MYKRQEWVGGVWGGGEESESKAHLQNYHTRLKPNFKHGKALHAHKLHSHVLPTKDESVHTHCPQ